MQKILISICLVSLFLVGHSYAQDDDMVFNSDISEISDSRLEPVSNRYYQARPDYRRCMWPMCGGMFVKAVNRRLTRCADGRWAEACYVAELEWKVTSDPFSDREATLLRGYVKSREYDESGEFGVFFVQEAYRSATPDEPQGTFVGLRIEDVDCVTYPCFFIGEDILNYNLRRKASDLNMDDVDAGERDFVTAVYLLEAGETLIAAGENVYSREENGINVTFVADQYYLPIRSMNGLCDLGYEFRDGKCLTPHNCEAPLLEMASGTGTIPIDETGPDISYSCVDQCDGPDADYTGPASCFALVP